jgi:hypothetical protein
MASKNGQEKHAGRTRGPKGAGQAPKPSPVARRKQRQREERLALIKQQVKEGTLTIRKMTAAERKKFPPASAPRKKRY